MYLEKLTCYERKQNIKITIFCENYIRYTYKQKEQSENVH